VVLGSRSRKQEWKVGKTVVGLIVENRSWEWKGKLKQYSRRKQKLEEVEAGSESEMCKCVDMS
jgi:hypothetical protein